MKNVGICLNGKNTLDLQKLSVFLNINNWIAVDGGYHHLSKYNIIPDVFVGDNDSNKLNIDKNVYKILLNQDKDVSDGEYALNYVINNYEYNYIFIIAIIDDTRLEHFIYTLFKFNKKRVVLLTKNNIFFYVNNSCSIKYLPNCDYVSFLALKQCLDLSINNCLYPINHQNVDKMYMSLSNEFLPNKDIQITFLKGQLLVIYSIKNNKS